ncbi:TPA: hypothetical protein ACIDX1_000088 [Pseudomonas aeruginosa]
MGGREAIRGFSIQTLICLLDSLDSKNESWEAVTIEPDSFKDKVDILWEFPGGRRRLQQIKSSKNQIGLADVVPWCDELKGSGKADSYQLMLAGPIAASVLSGAPFNGVEVPLPVSLDTLALIEQAVTKLDRYLASRKISLLSVEIRESLIYLISARLLDGAIHGVRLVRDQFDGWILQWITSAYPEAIEQRLSVECSVLWSSLEISSPMEVSKRAFEILLPLTVVNGGASIAVVEWFLIKVLAQGRVMLYRPVSVAPEAGSGTLTRRMVGTPFGEFAICPNSAVRRELMFIPIEREGYTVDEWPHGRHELELFVKYSGQSMPRSVKKVSIEVAIDESSVLGTDGVRHISISNLESFLDAF